MQLPAITGLLPQVAIMQHITSCGFHLTIQGLVSAACGVQG